MIKLEGGDDFGRLAASLRSAADRDLRREVYKAMREVAKPLGQTVTRDGAAQMPRRGGLSARLAAAQVGVMNSSAGANPKVTVRLKTREGYDLRALDKGQLRHPVFGRSAWVEQSVPAQAYSEAFDRGAPKVRAAVLEAAERILDQVARKV